MKFLAILFLTAITASAADWTRLRGPNGSGIAEGASLPGEISAEKNVVWKTAVPMGKSSPVVISDRIFLTGHDGGKLVTLALDRKNGKLLGKNAAPGNRDESRHKLNDPASPTPASDGRDVYVFFAGFGLISYDRDGVERDRKRHVSPGDPQDGERRPHGHDRGRRGHRRLRQRRFWRAHRRPYRPLSARDCRR